MAIVVVCAVKRCETCKVCVESKRPAEIDVVTIGQVKTPLSLCAIG